MSSDTFSTSNPAIREYEGANNWGEAATCTVTGVAMKSLVLFAIMLATGAYTWDLATKHMTTAFKASTSTHKVPDAIDLPPEVIPLALCGLFGAFGVAMVIIFFQPSAPYLSPIYAGLEGLALGAISAGFEAKYPGIAVQALGGTLGTTAGMLVLYSTGILRPTQGFACGLLAAMFGILCLYLVDDVLIAFGSSYIPLVHDHSWYAIGLQGVIVVVAALNLIIDFGSITEAQERGAPKWYEWYGAFSLMVTLVWLYIELLELLAKLYANSSDSSSDD